MRAGHGVGARVGAGLEGVVRAGGVAVFEGRGSGVVPVGGAGGVEAVDGEDLAGHIELS